MPNLNIPRNINLDLQIPLDEAVILLEKHRTEPDETDLSLILKDANYKNWPKNIQYFTAIMALKFHLSLLQLETYPEYRKWNLKSLTREASASSSYILTALSKLAVKNSWIFNNSIKLLAKTMLPEVKPETVALDKYLNSPSNSLMKERFEDEAAFSETPERKKFDKARIGLTSSFYEDILDAVLAKHTTDDTELGKAGKEFNIQKLVLMGVKIAETQKESIIPMKEYLEEFENPIQNSKELQKKKERAVAAGGDSLRVSLELFKSIGEVLVRSENIQTLLNTIDTNVLPGVFENPLDQKKIPMHEWLQHRVLEPLNL